jgi:hypothetical protein
VIDTLKEKKERSAAFWERKNGDRPLFGFRLQLRGAEASRKCRPEDLDLDLIVRAALEDHQACAGIEQDSVWAAEPPRCAAWVEDALEAGPDAYLRVVRALSAASGGRFPVAQAEICGPAKILIRKFGSEGLPESLRRYESMFASRISAIERAQNALLAATAATSRLGEGSVLGGLHLWAPGTCVLLQDEGSGFLDAGEYERHFLPWARRISERTDFAAFSLGPDRLHLLEPVLKLESVACIDFRIDRGAPPLVDVLPLLERIQERGKCLCIRGPINKEDLDAILDNLSFRGLYLKMENRTPAEARFWSAYILDRCRSGSLAGA